MITATKLKRAGVGITVAAGILICAGGAQGAVTTLTEAGQRPSVVVTPQDSVYLTWLNPATNDPVFCPIIKFKSSCERQTRLQGAGTTDSGDPPFVFAPGLPGKPVYVVQSRSINTDTLFAWDPTTGPDPVNLGFGSAREDATLGLEGLNGNPPLPTVHAVGEDSDGVMKGFVQKGFPLGGTEADRTASGLVLERDHLANASITTVREPKLGVDQRPVAVFDNNAETFFAVGKHPSDGVSPSVFRHWNTGVEWLPTRKLLNGGSARLAKANYFGSKDAFAARAVFADDEGRPAVATFGMNGLLKKPIVLGEYATGGSTSGGDIQHAIARGRDSRFYVVWVASNSYGPDSLLLALSDKNGGTFFEPIEIAQGDDIRNIALGVGTDKGAVAWSKNFIGSEASPVRYTSFSTPGGTAGSGSARAAASRKPFASKSAVKANAAVGKTSFATVLARNGCVTRGKVSSVRVLVGGARGTKRPRVSRVAVTVRGRTRVDRKGPFAVKLSTRKLRRGSRPRVTVKLLRGRRTVKTLKYRLQTCR